MFSPRTTREAGDFDEALLYSATGVALAAALLASGWASGSARVGLMGAALAASGVWTSWHTRHWAQNRRWALGITMAGLAAGSLHALISWEIATGVSMLYVAVGDVGLGLALRMAVPLVGFSFLLVQRDALPFSLVPALTLFGLTGGRGTTAIAFGCFLLFLPAALFALAQAMLLSGLPPNWGAGRDLGRWRSRHWLTLGLVIAAILGIGTLIYIPAFSYGTQYYWQFAMMNFGGGGFGRMSAGPRRADISRSYSVGNGPIVPTENPVLSYEGEPAQFWRGEVFDIYNGRSWRSSDDSPQPLRAPHLDLVRSVPTSAESQPLVHTVRTEAEIPLIIYAPGRIEIADLSPEAAIRVSEGIHVDKFGCIVAPGATFPRGAEYTIASDPRSFTAAAGGISVSGSSPQDLETNYLRIPLGSRRVADLARRLTAEAAGPSDKLAALTGYLQQNCAYTLDAPAVPAGEDAADFFLFHSKRGYCDLFATGLAVMARAAGVPTRFVVGYAGGQYDPESGRYLLRESDAHAWVEAYVPPHGWMSVDSAPAGGATRMPPLQRLYLATQFFIFDHRALVIVLLVTAVLLVIGLVLWRRYQRESLRLGLDKQEPRTIVIRAYARLNRLLAKGGRPRRAAQTPLEYLTALEAGGARLGRAKRAGPLPAGALAPIRALTAIFLRARYGPGPVAVQAAGAALQHLGEVRQALRRPGSRSGAG